MRKIHKKPPCDPLSKWLGAGLGTVLAIAMSLLFSHSAPADGFEMDLPADPAPAAAGDTAVELVPAPGLEKDVAVQRLITIVQAQGLMQGALGPRADIKRFADGRRARFEVLPNWDQTKSAALLLPNHEPGSGQFLMIELIEQGTDFAPRTITLDPRTTASPVSRYDR